MSELPVQWPTQAKRWLLAVSGGLDSMCLLHLAYQAQQADASIPAIEVIHVNHGLQDQADAWQAAVELQAAEYGFICHSRQVFISQADKRASGVEGAARDARYGVFENIVQIGDVLLLAQHADDQVETFMLRLLRGAGVAGLGAMPQQRPLGKGDLIRPLLRVSRQQLQQYADRHQLSCVQDPSNEDHRFDRNYLRHRVIPTLQERWPSLSQRVQTTSNIMQETQSLLMEVGEADLNACTDDGAVIIDALQQLSPARRNNVLRCWLSQQGEQFVEHGMLVRLNAELLLAAADGQPEIQFDGGVIRRSYGRLVWLPRGEQKPWHAVSFVWQGTHNEMPRISLANGWLVPDEGGFVLNLGDELKVIKRTGGERCRPVGRAHSQSLKKLLQEAKVPAWQRQHLPLVYVNNQLVAVADLWLCQLEGDKPEVGKGWRFISQP